MKKFFGILFLLIGVMLMVIGTALIVSANANPLPAEGQSTGTMQNSDRNTGRMLMVGGLILFVSGTTIIASKKKTPQKKGIPLETPTTTPERPEAAPSSIKATNDVLHQLERLTALKEKGTLTEEEFQQQKKKILE